MNSERVFVAEGDATPPRLVRPYYPPKAQQSQAESLHSHPQQYERINPSSALDVRVKPRQSAAVAGSVVDFVVFSFAFVFFVLLFICSELKVIMS